MSRDSKWDVIVFNNLHIQLLDFFAPTKPRANRDNTEFGVAQMVDILFQNWFPIDLIFIVPNSKEEDESAGLHQKPIL
jgi:hypothetical protein